jgi:hypothetical protein
MAWGLVRTRAETECPALRFPPAKQITAALLATRVYGIDFVDDVMQAAPSKTLLHEATKALQDAGTLIGAQVNIEATGTYPSTAGMMSVPVKFLGTYALLDNDTAGAAMAKAYRVFKRKWPANATWGVAYALAMQTQVARTLYALGHAPDWTLSHVLTVLRVTATAARSFARTSTWSTVAAGNAGVDCH